MLARISGSLILNNFSDISDEISNKVDIILF